MPLKQLKQGQNYKIVYQIWGVQQKPRVAVMTFLAYDDNPISKEDMVFSLRPLAGTQNFNSEWIIAIRPTDDPVAMEQMWQVGK